MTTKAGLPGFFPERAMNGRNYRVILTRKKIAGYKLKKSGNDKEMAGNRSRITRR